jgi:hypothetical protein
MFALATLTAHAASSWETGADDIVLILVSLFIIELLSCIILSLTLLALSTLSLFEELLLHAAKAQIQPIHKMLIIFFIKHNFY